MSQIRIAVDAANLLGRQLSALEREQLPFAIMQACNATAFEIRETWKRTAPRVFDRPSPLTINAALYTKATKQSPFAEIFLRDRASNGTSPAKYLLAEVEGGTRRRKGLEVLLQAKGLMPAGQFAQMGRGASLDQFGNVRRSQVKAVLSQLQAQSPQQIAGRESSARSRKRQSSKNRGGQYFAITKQRGRLKPGIYERVGTGFGSAVRSIFIFTESASYTPRYDIFGLAQRTWDKLMPFYFNRELDKAIQSAIAKVRA
ncbi:hypothetical protein [Xanthomonas melonis]|uniref:Phage virion morphogenesis protein n=1 Tax=Xanthomonas melonis TaxID=56456 RepID=A0A2S7DEJ8_9XANT|nr:hypothetical protein [Xanthomonas melonis]MCC4600302.1 hypothetical protein [Xanthomonas melonis]PPU72253.1 hypothetical protein XmelCFBP4644_12285 [Xanthomonas melonis]